MLQKLRHYNLILLHHPKPSSQLSPYAYPIAYELPNLEDDAEAVPCSPTAAQGHKIADKSSLSHQQVNQEQSKAAEGKPAVSQEATFSEDLPQACFAYQAKIANHPLNNPIKFDYESFLIGIDNHASRCISNCIDDFQSAIKPTNKQLAGISGSLTIKGTGTVKWIIEDDDGIHHSINIPNTLYVPEAPM
jgi:hypothetical protein